LYTGYGGEERHMLTFKHLRMSVEIEVDSLTEEYECKVLFGLWVAVFVTVTIPDGLRH